MREIDNIDNPDDFEDIFGDLNMTMLHSGVQHLVFVYGTLMKGKRNHRRLMDNAAELIDENALVVGQHRMKCRKTGGNYDAPIVIEKQSNSPAQVIIGELYSVSDHLLHALDAFEGHPDVYERKKVFVESTDSTSIVKAREAWMYYFVASADGATSDNIEGSAGTGTHFGRFHYKWRGL